MASSLQRAYSSVGSDSRDVGGSFYQISSSFPHSMFQAAKEGMSTGEVLNSTGWRAAFEVNV